MFDCSDLVRDVGEGGTDPRLDSRYVRCFPGGPAGGTVMLLGVVHDHPASLGRVASLLDLVAPDVLALELPPLAVPLFRQYGADEYTPPRLGGEMSTAIQAVDDVPLVGIDGPNRSYARRLFSRVLTSNLSPSDSWAVLRDLANGFGHAVACRLGALVGAATPVLPKVYSHLSYDRSLLDTAESQADHEHEHVTQREAFVDAIEVPRSMALIDETRNDSMAAAIDDLRGTGDVVAIVGVEHLDPLADRLETAA